MTRRITLLTDFGTADGYVAAMKGVLATRCPAAPTEDVSHAVPPGDVRAGMWALRRYWAFYPVGTVHLVVVDPGVGTERRALAVEADGRFVVAPDNGVATFVLTAATRPRSVEIRDVVAPTDRISTTFHGRDLFAPAAAHLALGGGLESLGPPIDDPVTLPPPVPGRTPDGADGEVVHVDRFGNLVTNLPRSWTDALPRVEVAGRTLALAPSYGHVEEGELLAVVASDGLVEIAVRGASAAERLATGVGEPVRLTR